jgi:hypothetical protein
MFLYDFKMANRALSNIGEPVYADGTTKPAAFLAWEQSLSVPNQQCTELYGMIHGRSIRGNENLHIKAGSETRVDPTVYIPLYVL